MYRGLLSCNSRFTHPARCSSSSPGLSFVFTICWVTLPQFHIFNKRFQQQRRPTRPLSVDPTKDYSIPLSVDCSVEYDLPRVIRPPPGAQPLLLIAPRLQRPVQSACWSTEGLVSSSGSLLPGRSSSCSTSSGDSGHWSETCSSSSSSSSSVPPAWMMRGDYPLQRTGRCDRIT